MRKPATRKWYLPTVRLGALAMAAAVAMAGCSAGSPQAPTTSTAAASTVQPLGPLPPVPVPPDNPMTPEKVELGKLLFFDNRLSGDTSTSCFSCHDPAKGWGDGNAVSRGYPGTKHWRNSQTILNSAYYAKLFWAGESLSLEKQANSAFTGNLAGNLDPDLANARLAQIPEYVQRFRAVFGTESPQYTDALRAVAAFERTLVSQNVPFDRYMQGDKSALSAEAVRGLELFQGKAGCIQCHSGPLLSDESYYNIGVPRNPEFETDVMRQIAMRWQFRSRGVAEEVYRKADRDLGLYFTTKREEDKGKFRTPSLRELVYTAPYMHNGVFKTLEEVVAFYNDGGDADPNKDPRMQRLRLSKDEQAALVAFLKSLSGDPVIVKRPELPQYEVLPAKGIGAGVGGPNEREGS